jgi:hypothetical protein
MCEIRKDQAMKIARFDATDISVFFSFWRYTRRALILVALSICLAGISTAQLGVAYIQELQPPSSPVAPASDLTLTIIGVNIDTTAVVMFDGNTLTGTCSGFNKCVETVPKSLLATAHTAVVTVANPTFIASNAVFFPVTASAPSGFTNTAAVVGAGPQAIAEGDFNNDGKPDLVVVNSADNDVSILLGNGDGTFQSQSTKATGHNPQAVVVGDFDHDGNLDIVVANRDDNTLSLLKGNGHGGFADQVIIDTLPGVAPIGLATVDLDFDGNLDLFVINQNDQNCSSNTGNGSLEALFGDGTGAFSTLSPKGSTSVANICLNIAPMGIATGDIDNNALHFPDFAISSGSVPSGVTCAPGDGTVTVVDGTSIYNRSQGSIFPPTVTPSCAGQNPGGITVGDFNNDGVLDVAVTNTSGKFAVLLNTGNGVFGFTNTQTSYVTYPAGTGSPTTIVAADINGDGKLDLAMADEGAGTVAISNGNGDGTFPNPFGGSIASTANSNPGGRGPIGLVAADFNADGRLDIATANHNDTPGTVTLMLQAPQLTVLCISSASDGCIGPPQPGLSGAPALLFGNVVVGSASAILKIKVENDGSAPITYSTITNAANFFPATSDFTQTNTCGTSLDIGANCEIDVTFSPHGSGDLNSALEIPGLNGSFQFVSVSGTGVEAAMTFTPQALAFGQFLINAPTGTTVTAPLLPATLTNTGDSDLTISAVASLSAEFKLKTEACTAASPLKANDSCGFTVEFDPTQVGLRMGTIQFTTNLGNILFTVYGQGTAPTVSLSNPPLLFSNQQVGTTSPSQTITLTNIGNGQLFFADNVPAFALAGTNPGDFSESAACPVFPAYLDVGQNCLITITFTPLMALPTPIAARTATLVITDNNAGQMTGNHPSGQQSAGLNGTATAPVVSYNVPLSPTVGLNYGGVPFNTTSAAQSFVISNVGTAPLSITSIVSTNTPEFLLVGDTCPLLPATLAVNTNCTVTVKFTPGADGDRSGTIVITDNDKGTPSFITTQTVALIGAGTDFSLSVSPTSITIPAGKTATYSIMLNPNPLGTTAPFTSPVVYSCAGGPPHSNCFISGVSNGSATVILSTSKGVNHGTFTLTFTATYTAVSPAGGPPGLATLAHSTNASITVK